MLRLTGDFARALAIVSWKDPMCQTDIYQPFRMLFIWPVLVGCVAFYAVRFIAALLGGTFTRWQAVMAAVTGLMAGVVTAVIASQWTGDDLYWLAFSVGLTFAALVLFAGTITVILQADP